MKEILDRIKWYFYIRPRVPEIYFRIKERNLTYLSLQKFMSLHMEVRRIKRQRVPDDFGEYGVALGGSAIYLASELDEGRHFRGYDVFRMIPPPSENDREDSHARYQKIAGGESQGLGGDKYYGYMDDLYQRVVRNFEDFGMSVDQQKIVLSEGLFADTVHYGDEDRIAVAHIDCDWYDPVMYCLETVAPVLSPGGVFVIDDYNDYGGCRDATDLFLSRHPEFKVLRSQPHLVACKLR